MNPTSNLLEFRRFSNAQYTPPSRRRRRDSAVELSRVGGVYWAYGRFMYTLIFFVAIRYYS